MKKVFGNIAWTLGTYLLLCIYHMMSVPYFLQFELNPSLERESSFLIDFLTAPVGAGFLVAILLGIVIAFLKNADIMHLQNLLGVRTNLRESWKDLLKRLLLVFAGVVVLTLFFDYFSGRLYTVVADMIMKLTHMDHLDQIALVRGYDDIPFATMRIAAGFAGAIVPYVFSIAELFLVYLVYKVVCLLFCSQTKKTVIP